jgi:hypothetical protein
MPDSNSMTDLFLGKMCPLSGDRTRWLPGSYGHRADRVVLSYNVAEMGK